MEHEGIGIKTQAEDVTAIVVDCLGYVRTLVMEHHADNVEARVLVGMLEASRFIDKHAQCLIHELSHKR